MLCVGLPLAMWDIPYPFIPSINLLGNKRSQALSLSPFFLSFPSFLPSLSHLLSITHAHFLRKRVSDRLRERVLSKEEKEEEEKRKKIFFESSIQLLSIAPINEHF
jgi:hypothetical protein